jgi:malate-CoA ligase subunit alpha
VSILLDEHTPVMVYGLPGSQANFYANVMLDYGTHVVSGVSPRHGGHRILDRPVFTTTDECVRETGPTAALIFADAASITDAILEVADAGIKLIVAVSEGHRVPVWDKLGVRQFFERWSDADRPLLLGPEAAGILSAEQAMVGVMPPHVFARGPIGVVTRSASLGYEAAARLTAAGIGQSTFVGLGADGVSGTEYVQVLARFESDPATEAILLLGEPGGPAEAEAAAFAAGMSKPVVTFLPARPQPTGRGALAERIVDAFGDQASGRPKRITSSGMIPVPHVHELTTIVADTLARFTGGRRPRGMSR